MNETIYYVACETCEKLQNSFVIIEAKHCCRKCRTPLSYLPETLTPHRVPVSPLPSRLRTT